MAWLLSSVTYRCNGGARAYAEHCDRMSRIARRLRMALRVSASSQTLMVRTVPRHGGRTGGVTADMRHFSAMRVS